MIYRPFEIQQWLAGDQLFYRLPFQITPVKLHLLRPCHRTKHEAVNDQDDYVKIDISHICFLSRQFFHVESCLQSKKNRLFQQNKFPILRSHLPFLIFHSDPVQIHSIG